MTWNAQNIGYLRYHYSWISFCLCVCVGEQPTYIETPVGHLDALIARYEVKIPQLVLEWLIWSGRSLVWTMPYFEWLVWKIRPLLARYELKIRPEWLIWKRPCWKLVHWSSPQVEKSVIGSAPFMDNPNVDVVFDQHNVWAYDLTLHLTSLVLFL